MVKNTNPQTRPPDSERLLFAAEHSAIWLVAIVGLSLSLAALWLIRQQLAANQLLDFEWVAHNRVRAISHGIDNGLRAVTTIRDLYAASDQVAPEEFREFSNALLRRYRGIKQLMWVSKADENAQRIADEFAHEPTQKNRPISFLLERADGQSDRFTLTNSAPDSADNAVLAANSQFKQMLQQAMQSGDMAATARMTFSDSATDPVYGFLAGLPVYRRHSATDTEEQRRDNLLGFVVGRFRLDELIDAAISLLEPRGVEILLMDATAAPAQRFLYFYASRLAARDNASFNYLDWLTGEDEPKLAEEIRVADRNWRIVSGQTHAFRSAEAFRETPWVALVTGLLFTMLLSFYLVRIRESAQERMAMQVQLVEREELFRQMTETVDEVFWAVTTDATRLLYLSPAYERIFGNSSKRGEDRGRVILDSVPNDDKVRLKKGLSKILREHASMEVVHRVNQGDGSTRWVRTRGFPVDDESGQVCRIVGFFEDITEKKLAEEALQESEAKLRDMFQQSPDIIMTVDQHGKILLMNRSIPELPAERAVGRNSLALMPYEFRKWFRRALKKVFRKGVIRQFEYSADDGIYWEGRIVPIRADGPVAGAMVIATDVTEKRKLEFQALRNARLASIGVLSAGVAHEINNPNNAIQFNASLVSRAWADIMPILDEYQADHGDFALGGLAYSDTRDTFPMLLSEIARNSSRIKQIVENLKHMARQDPGRLSEDVDIQQVLESTLMILHNQIQKYTDVCSLQVPDNLPRVKGNSQQLEQVFINLLMNALQSLPDRSKGIFITAGFNAADENLEIIFRDQGSGISKHDLGRLTEPFFTTRPDSGGTGLGLSISRSIVEKHGGSMTFDSEQGVGTSVSIRVPTARSG